MKQVEFENKIKEFEIKKIDIMKSNEEKAFYVDQKTHDIYGVYWEEGKYVIFFIDLERSVMKELGKYTTIEAGYDKLLKTIVNGKNNH